MCNKKHNGWTNYATWRVNLEVFDGRVLEDFTTYNPKFDTKEETIQKVAELMKQEIEELMEEQGVGLVVDYALAFVSDVNWYEIAESLVEEWEAEQ